MSWRNTHERYGHVAQALHWAIALLILANIGMGLTMGGLDRGPLKSAFYAFHKSFGITILVLALVRIWWRHVNVVPPLPDGLTTVEVLLAKLTHRGLYAAMILVPISGYVFTEIFAGPVRWFGIPIPRMFGENEAIGNVFKLAHTVFGYALCALLALHLGGVAKHALILKDGTLGRMLPRAFGRR